MELTVVRLAAVLAALAAVLALLARPAGTQAARAQVAPEGTLWSLVRAAGVLSARR